MPQNATKKIHPKEGENGDYLFSELNDPAFEEAISLATVKIMEQHRAENDDESLEIEDQPVRKWEYMIIGLTGSVDDITRLDREGSEGWELVAVVLGDHSSEKLAYFKKELS